MPSNLNLSGKLKNEIGKQASNLDIPSKGSEAIMDINNIIKSIPSNESENKEQIIRRPVKTMKLGNLIGKNKMKKPIGKITSMKPIMGEGGEKTEATGAASSGQFSQPLFSDMKEKPSNSKPKKTETKEATGAASSGQYQTNKMWAKSMNKKDWRGASKTQIPGGKFVQVKKKCKTFPYCNQGDINALKLFENETIKKVISKVSKENNISESVIKTILAYEYEKFKNNK